MPRIKELAETGQGPATLPWPCGNFSSAVKEPPAVPPAPLSLAPAALPGSPVDVTLATQDRRTQLLISIALKKSCLLAALILAGRSLK